MRVTTLDSAASLAAAAIEDFGILTRQEAKRAYKGDTLALFVYQEVRESFEDGTITTAGIEEARRRISQAIRELDAVARKLNVMEAP